MPVEHRLRHLARAVVDVDIGSRSVFGNRELNAWKLSALTEAVGVADVVDGVEVAQVKLLRCLQGRPRGVFEENVQAKLLIARAPVVLARDALYPFDQVDRVTERVSVLVSERGAHQRVGDGVVGRALGNHQRVEVGLWRQVEARVFVICFGVTFEELFLNR